MALIVNDRNAGDKAWQEWFAICSVAGCGVENAAKLRKQVENATLDADNYRRRAEKILETLSRKIKTEKEKVALLLYATAQDVSITDAAVLEGLKTAKSRAYAIREKAKPGSPSVRLQSWEVHNE